MEIGLSLLPYFGKNITEIVNMAHSLKIKNFELPFEYSYFLPSNLNMAEISSVHASKNMLEKQHGDFCAELSELSIFCKACGCKKIVFHPNPDILANNMYFSLLREKFPEYCICMENTCENYEGLIPLLYKYNFRITWDYAHAAFHNHVISDKMELIEYFHVRGFSMTEKYVTLMASKKDNIVPMKKDAVYILEYPYVNMYELLMDWKLLNSIMVNGCV